MRKTAVILTSTYALHHCQGVTLSLCQLVADGRIFDQKLASLLHRQERERP